MDTKILFPVPVIIFGIRSATLLQRRRIHNDLNAVLSPWNEPTMTSEYNRSIFSGSSDEDLSIGPEDILSKVKKEENILFNIAFNAFYSVI